MWCSRIEITVQNCPSCLFFFLPFLQTACCLVHDCAVARVKPGRNSLAWRLSYICQLNAMPGGNRNKQCIHPVIGLFSVLWGRGDFDEYWNHPVTGSCEQCRNSNRYQHGDRPVTGPWMNSSWTSAASVPCQQHVLSDVLAGAMWPCVCYSNGRLLCPVIQLRLHRWRNTEIFSNPASSKWGIISEAPEHRL